MEAPQTTGVHRIPDDSASEPSRSRSRRRRSKARHGLLRRLYFGASAFWGCVCGLTGVAVGLDLSGRPMQMNQSLLVILCAALVASIVGGVVISLAYREMVSREKR